MVIVASFQAPESPVMYEQRNTRAVLNKRDLGIGTVYISERTLCWKEQGDAGLTMEYPHITMHAISTDPNVYPNKCIYVMIDAFITLPGDVAPTSTDSDSESEEEFSELILAPSDLTAVPPMYEALKQCQALNPDPDDSNDELIYEDAEENGMYEDHEVGAGGDADVQSLADRLQNQGVHVTYEHSNGNQNVEEEQFEDAD